MRVQITTADSNEGTDHMDRLSKWATTGSLAWLAMAVGLILGTHGESVQGAQSARTEAAPATEACPDAPVAAVSATVEYTDHTRS